MDIDEAMKNGFGWKYGPFELLDKMGSLFIKDIFIKSKKDIPTILDQIADNSFYKVKSNKINYFDFQSNKFKTLKRSDGIISRATKSEICSAEITFATSALPISNPVIFDKCLGR